MTAGLCGLVFKDLDIINILTSKALSVIQIFALPAHHNVI